MYRILYGTDNSQIDITDICYTKMLKDHQIIIPGDDNKRADFFGDPFYGTLKNIYIVDNDQVYSYDTTLNVIIDTQSNIITTSLVNNFYKFRSELNLQLNHGTFDSEEPEQIMSHTFLKGNEKVLEIGGNIGRNSLIIASILKSQTNTGPLQFVTLECDQVIAQQLIENRNINNLDFFIENSALSERRLIQKGWDTFPLENNIIEEGFTEVKTITWKELNEKYNIEFDTLVLDCEGAFYYILKDTPFILANINLVIMENDYHILEHKRYVDSVLSQYGFNRVYSKSGGWGCCADNFFEVWRK